MKKVSNINKTLLGTLLQCTTVPTGTYLKNVRVEVGPELLKYCFEGRRVLGFYSTESFIERLRFKFTRKLALHLYLYKACEKGWIT